MSLIVRLADWDTDRNSIRNIREQVFIQEQKVPAELEWDSLETSAQHFLVLHEGEAIGTGRITSSGKIGRMAVKKSARGIGAGQLLLENICGYAHSQGLTKVYLNAQCRACNFYQKLGFVSVGTVFDEANIPHIRMERCF